MPVDATAHRPVEQTVGPFVRSLVALLILCWLPHVVSAEPPARMLMLGVFHFANPGADVVKTDVIDVTTQESQAYLEKLAERLAHFRPTAVLVEMSVDEAPQINKRYASWRAGTGVLGVDEIEQIGFRVAQLSDLDHLLPFDERTIGWAAGELFAHMQAHEPALAEQVQAEIKAMTERMASAQARLQLGELLAMTNAPEEERRNLDVYLLTNAAAAGDSYVGADTTARWWQRNLRMYSLIQRHAIPGARLLVIGGQGHTALLRRFAEVDRRIELEDVLPYL